jgi:hypothetical protein
VNEGGADRDSYILDSASGYLTYWDAGTKRLGVGTNTPNATLDVRGSVIFNEAGGDFDFRVEGTGNSSLFVIDASTDRIGIGAIAPQKTLEIRQTAATIRLVDPALGVTWDLGLDGNKFKYSNNALSFLSYVYENGSLELGSTPAYTETRRIKVFDNGISGSSRISLIGTSGLATPPALEFVFDGSTSKRAIIRFEDEGSSDYGLSFFVTDNGTIAERMRLSGNGYLGIGTTAPSQLLDVRGGAIFNEAGGDFDFRVEGDTNVNLLFVDGGVDRVGINNGDPSGKLDVVQSSTTAAIPVITVTQADVSEEFMRFIGTSANNVKTQSIVENADISGSTLVGWLKIYVQDDGNQVTDQAYYVPFYTLS